MATSYVEASDGSRIAYDVAGSGPALLLLHGGGRSRRDWHGLGYVERLRGSFQVITLDLRGHGESDQPEDPAAYAIDRLCQDVLAVADACEAERFALWGFSYGGNIGRYLAAHSTRLSSFAMIGIAFGLGASGPFRDFIEEQLRYWGPMLQAHRQGTLDLDALSEEERQAWREHNVPISLAYLGAMLDWPAIEPADLRCPTLWLVGSENAGAMAKVPEHAEALAGTSVSLKIIPGLNHQQELTEIEQVLPDLLSFTRRAGERITSS